MSVQKLDFFKENITSFLTKKKNSFLVSNMVKQAACVVTGRSPAAGELDNTWANGSLCAVCILTEWAKAQSIVLF